MKHGACVFVSWMPGACSSDPPTAEPGWWICRVCERPRTRRQTMPEPIGVYRECVLPGATPAVERPGLRQRAKNWRDATAAWKAAGSPERSAEDQATLAEICRGCEHYQPDPLLPIVMGGGQCKACGCGIQPERKLFNALRFATYRCKLGKWNGAPVLFVNPPAPAAE